MTYKMKEKFGDLLLKWFGNLGFIDSKEESIQCINCKKIIDTDFDELRKCSCGCSLFVIDSKRYTIDKGTVHCSCKKGNLENVCHVNCDHGSIEEYVCSNCKNKISIYQVV